MALILQAAEDQILALVCDGLGTAAPYSTQAQRRAIPANRFRRTLASGPLRDVSYPAAQFDRAVFLDWITSADSPTDNPLTTVQLRAARVNVTVGYFQGQSPDNTAFLQLITGTPGEDPVDALNNPRKRALSDGERIKRCLEFPELFENPASDPILVNCQREGPSRVEDLGGNRMLGVTTFVVLFEANSDQDYDP